MKTPNEFMNKCPLCNGSGSAFVGAPDAISEIERLKKELDGLKALLGELTALVRGECPSLLNEDSGGDGALSVKIDLFLKGETK